MRRTIVLTTLAVLQGATLLAAASSWASISLNAGSTLRPQAVAPAVSVRQSAPAAVTAPKAQTSKPAAHPARHQSAHRPATHRTLTRAVRRTVTHATTRAVVRPTMVQRTPEELMRYAVRHIPGYHSGLVTWAIVAGQDHWGLAELGGTHVYISAAVPASYMYDVVAHEWSHMVSVTAYGGDVQAALDGMNVAFDGTGTTGAERAADCMAKALGAKWTHYTPCDTVKWQQAARRLLAGEKA